MARLLSSVGTVSYNGFTFPAPFEAEVTATPRRDSSGRVIKYITYTITIKTTIVPDDAPKSTADALVDDNLENIRCRLLKPGGSLKFIGQGFGTDFVVNSTGAYTDPDTSGSVQSFKIDPTFGPFPTILTWRPVGSNRACQIVWTVEVTIPDCCQQETTSLQKFLEYNYTVSFDINDEGVSTRIIQGRYEIPGYRIGAPSGVIGGGGSGSRIAQTADAYWDQVYNSFPLINGFRREHRRSISAAKNICDFTITDTEIPSQNGLFPYMVKMDVSHTISMSAPGLILGKLSNSISGSIVVAPNTPRHFAWLAFGKIVAQRLRQSNGMTYNSKGQSSQSKQQKTFPIPTNITITENLYARSLSFQYDWFFVTDIQSVFRGSGLFRPVSHTGLDQSVGPNSASWSISMAELTYKARGLANLAHELSDDLLITFCDPQFTVARNNRSVEYVAGAPILVVGSSEASPPPESSYITMHQSIVPTQETDTVKHRKIKNVSQNSPNPKAPGSALGIEAHIDNNTQETASDVDHTIQVRGPSTYSVTIMGYALRWGYPIAIPQVSSIGGQTPAIKSVDWSQGIVGKILGTPVYAAAWAIALDLTKIPAGDILRAITTNGNPEDRM